MWKQTIEGRWIFIIDHLYLLRNEVLTESDIEKEKSFFEELKKMIKDYNLKIAL